MDSLSLRQDVFKDVSDSIFPVTIREKVELLLERWLVNRSTIVLSHLVDGNGMRWLLSLVLLSFDILDSL